jgi:hypothetical protein
MIVARKGRVTYLETGPWPFYVGVTMCSKVFKKELDRLGVKGDYKLLCTPWADATTHHFEDKSGKLCVIIGLRHPSEKGVSDAQYAALVAHESLHAVQVLRNRINDGDCLGMEAEAYLLQSIVQSCLEIAWRRDDAVPATPHAG